MSGHLSFRQDEQSLTFLWNFNTTRYSALKPELRPRGIRLGDVRFTLVSLAKSPFAESPSRAMLESSLPTNGNANAPQIAC